MKEIREIQKSTKEESKKAIELIEDLIHFNHRNIDEYTRYRMMKACEIIKEYNKLNKE